MKLIADENISKWTIMKLRNAGYDGLRIQEFLPRGTPDARIIKIAIEHKAILITTDDDFGNTILYPPENHFGVIIVKLHQPNRHLITERLMEAISQMDSSKIIHRVFIIKDTVSFFRA